MEGAIEVIRCGGVGGRRRAALWTRASPPNNSARICHTAGYANKLEALEANARMAAPRHQSPDGVRAMARAHAATLFLSFITRFSASQIKNQRSHVSISLLTNAVVSSPTRRRSDEITVSLRP